MNKRGLRNLKSSEGSVLFIVLILMSLLVVIASAFFYAVRSEMANIKEDFKVEQTYQSAVAVNDWVFDYISAYINTTEKLDDIHDKCPLLEKMLNMNVSDLPLTASGEIPDNSGYELGEYEIKILLKEKTDDTYSTAYSFDIITTIENGINSEQIIRSCELKINKATGSDTYEGEEFYELSFSTTGGSASSSDLALPWSIINEPIYIGNDKIALKATSINAEFNAYGDVVIFDYTGPTFEGSNKIEMNIGGSFLGSWTDTKLMTCGGKVRIRESFIHEGLQFDGQTAIYVVGDNISPGANSFKVTTSNTRTAPLEFYINGNADFSQIGNIDGAVFFINGNLRVTDSANCRATFYVSGNVYCEYTMPNSIIKYTGDYTGGSNSHFVKITEFEWGDKAWPIKDSDATNLSLFPGRDYESITTVRNHIIEKTRSLEYDADGNKLFEADGVTYKSTGPISTPLWNPIEKLNEDPVKYANVLESLEENVIDLNQDKMVYVITESGKIVSSIPTDWGKPHTILIDTMYNASDKDDPTTHNDIYLKLCDTGGGQFTWKRTSDELNIVIRGAGSVFFFMDDNVEYALNGNSQYTFIGHEGWLKYMGYTATDPSDGSDLDGGVKYNQYNPYLNNFYTNIYSGLRSKVSMIADAIHENKLCTVSGCIYCNGLSGEMNYYPGRHLIRQDDDVNLIKRFSDGLESEKVFLHHNIYIIDYESIGGGSNLYSAPCQAYFGFIYAPYSKSAPSSWGENFPNFMIGGLNVSELNITEGAQYFYTTHIMPCDYYPYKRAPLERYIGKNSRGLPIGSSNTTDGIGSFGTNGYR